MGANALTISTGHAIDIFCYCVGGFQEVSAKVTTQVPVWETGEPGKSVTATAADNVLVNGVFAGGAVASAHIAHVPWHGTGWKIGHLWAGSNASGILRRNGPIRKHPTPGRPG